MNTKPNKRNRFLRLKFNFFVFLLCLATVFLAYSFDRKYLAERRTDDNEKPVVETNYIKRVQLNKVEDSSGTTETSEMDDEGIVTDTDEKNYIPVYEAADENSEVVEEIFTGEWAEYLDEQDNFVKVKTNKGNSGYVSGKQSKITKLVSNPKPKSLKDAVIVLDPGHGGNDVGAESTNRVYYEKDFTLATANAVKAKLEAAGAKVYLTRSKDSYVTLDDRTSMAVKYTADIFISLHYDSSDESDSMSGFTTYYYYEAHQSLANTINQGLIDAELPLNNVGVRADNFSVTRENPYPSLLLELGYINSYQDLIVIWDESYYEQVADGITKGLENYFSN